MQFKLFAALSLLALVNAATLAADKVERLTIITYPQEHYHGVPHRVPFEDQACIQLPTLTIKSIRIPDFYDCFFYSAPGCSKDDLALTAEESVPDSIPSNLQSFECDAEED